MRAYDAASGKEDAICEPRCPYPIPLRPTSTHTTVRVGVGEPKKPPCVACYESGSECILAKSRRGGNFRHYRRLPRTNSVAGQSDNTPGLPSGEPSNDEGRTSRDGSSDVLTMELRNPSDALQILALSSDPPQECQNINGPRTTDTALRGRSNASHGAENHTHSIHTAFDDYELVLKGVLRPGLVSELLLKYVGLCMPGARLLNSLDMPAATTHTVQSSHRISFVVQAPECFKSRITFC